MIPFLNRFFDSNEKEIKKFGLFISEINALEGSLKKLKEKDFSRKTIEFKERLTSGETLDAILPEVFALCREAAQRTVGLRLFDVQLMAGITLAHGRIAEQKTGEGKTLSAIPALYLHSLTGKNVHLVTVNDYLARRDVGWMGPIFNLLGVSVSSIINESSFIFDPAYTDEQAIDHRLIHLRPISRREAYQADVTYGINSEFGFDYLRDNMAQDIKDIVQRDYYFAVVDEVDSVLIDEARTPHIISAPDEAPSEKYYEYAKVIDKLSSDTDYKIDEKLRTAHLTDHGIVKIEKLYGIADIYEKDFDTVYHLEAALKARTLFHKEKDYIVRDNEVILVDEFTGRLMEGRRLSEGIHQAIEAKENVSIQRESKTLATVSLQNYFRMYKHLAGMTGTAVTEAEEFHKIYKLDVVVIPTNNPMIRSDQTDAVYKTTRAKMTAVVNDIESAHKKGQPVLVGTTSIEKNELLSQLLRRRGIMHEILNAKNHAREAQIIAQAGKIGAVTVATNMAGRGVDIILGGSVESQAGKNVKEQDVDKKLWEKNHKEVVAMGGLYVIGTERHESRRIDNQLRGRSGRQGDPGLSRFYVSLDDEIMRLFGGDRISGLMTRFNMPEDVPLEHALVSKSIEHAQIKVEGFNFDMRKHLVEYDDVLNKQREIIYKLRREILGKGTEETQGTKETKGTEVTTNLKGEILERVDKAVNLRVEMVAAGSDSFENYGSQNEQMIESFCAIVPFDENSKKQLVKQLEQYHTSQGKSEFLTNLAHDIYEKREQQFGSDMTRLMEKFVMLGSIDRFWMDHLDAIDDLRQGIGLRGYAQKDPLVEYKNEAFKMFEQLVFAIDDEIVNRVFKVQVQTPVMPTSRQHVAENIPAGEVSMDSKVNNVPKQTTNQSVSSVSTAKPLKLGRNDPCPCGKTDPATGKTIKYKKCHYPQYG
jgi:preprotein translocase subunit SecA